MNIEIANRLYQYRKSMGISQEELAARIGVSRQAVSKWERAEASPDTDNLLELSKIYGVSLDEMLRGEEEAEPQTEPADSEPADSEPAQADNVEDSSEAKSEGFTVHNSGDTVRFSGKGIHITDRNGTQVDLDREHGIFVRENGEQKVYTDEDGHIHKSEDIAAREHKESNPWLMIPYPIITVIAYLLFGYFNVCGGWGYGWIIFLTIPLYYSVIEAIRKRDADRFAYPVFAVIAFLIMGFVWNLWHPGWVIFLTIPVYYAIVKAFKRK